MSGRAAGDVFLVVSTRLVSWAVFMATSPPLGSIQWNLRFITKPQTFLGAVAQTVKEGVYDDR
jgi:hypothetical protein